MLPRDLLVLLLITISEVSSQPTYPFATWCGKPYNEGTPHITLPPDSRFSVPPYSSQELLNFRCNPAIRPYVSGFDKEGSIIIDAELTHDVGVPFSSPSNSSTSPYDQNLFQVAIEVNGRVLAGGPIKLGSRGTEFTFPLSALPRGPQTTSYNISCSASYSHNAVFHDTTLLHYLPPNENGGSVTKFDLRTGGLLVKGKDKTDYEPIIPFGFYTSTNILNDLDKIDEIKAKGWVNQGPVVKADVY